jgi:hypothetical protein
VAFLHLYKKDKNRVCASDLGPEKLWGLCGATIGTWPQSAMPHGIGIVGICHWFNAGL